MVISSKFQDVLEYEDFPPIEISEKQFEQIKKEFIDTKYCAGMYWIERNVFDNTVRFVGKVGFAICGASKWWDEHIVDALVRLTAQASVALCSLAKATDERVIDHGIIRGSAKGVMKTGSRLRRIQTGVVENYALYTLVGAISLIIIMIIVNGVLPL